MLKANVQSWGSRIRLLAAVEYFRHQKLSLGKAAQLAGSSRLDFIDALAERAIVVFHYDESAVVAELKGVAALEALETRSEY